MTDTTPTVYADLRTNVHDYWDRGLLGLASILLPDKSVMYVLYTYDAPLGEPRPCLQRRLRGSHRRQAAGSAPDSRGSSPTARRGDDRGLVPAVPEPLDRFGGLRPRRQPLRQRRRRGELQLGGLRAGRRGRQPVLGPARRGRRASQPGHADVARPTALNGAVLRIDPDTGAGVRRQPLRGQRRREREADHRSRTPQPLPDGLPARHQRALGRRRRLERVGGGRLHSPTRPTRRPRTSAGPATRGTRRQAGYDARTWGSASRCTRGATR